MWAEVNPDLRAEVNLIKRDRTHLEGRGEGGHA